MDESRPTPATALRTSLESALGSRADFECGSRPSDLTVRLHHGSDVPDAVAKLASEGLSLASLVGTDERAGPDGDFKVRYVFDPQGRPFTPPFPDIFVTLVASVDPDKPELPSITGRLPCANWHEREARDMFGIVFTGHPDPRSLVLHDGWPKDCYPLRKDFDARQRVAVEPAEEFPHLEVEGEGVLEVPVGPIHAGIIEPGHFRFSTVGESVLYLDPRLFYTHRGLEKRIEGLTANDAFYVVERICGVCSVSHGLGFCEAIERMAGVEVSEKARVLRTLALELERLYNHVGDVGNICAGASYHYGTSSGLRMKEAVQQVCERFGGSRFLRELVTPGGVRLDLTADLEKAIRTVIDDTQEALANLMARIENNASILDRLGRTGPLSYEDAVQLGVTGVGARASGVDRDARRDHPHAAFGLQTGPKLVEVVTSVEGDVQARMCVRVAEAQETMRLIRDLLESIPSGPLAVPMPDRLPAGSIGLSAIESPRGAAIHWVRADDAGRIDRYHLRSASYANWPAVALAAQTAIIPDFPLVNKSFELCYSCTDR